MTVLVLSSILFVFLMRKKAKDCQIALSLQEKFYKSVNILINKSDDVISDDAVDLLVLLTKHIRSKRLLRIIFWSIMTNPTEKGHASSKENWLDDVLKNMNEEASKLFVTAVTGHVVALTYNNLFLGPLARRFVFWGIDTQKGSGRAIRATREILREETSNHDPIAA